MKLPDFIKGSNPKKTIIWLFVIQLLVSMFLGGYTMVVVAIVFNAIVFLYALFLLKKQDYVSLKFFLRALIFVNVLSVLSTALDKLI